MMKSKINSELTLILSMAGLNGSIPLAAMSGLFKLENAVTLAFIFMAGPGAIVTAILLGGTVKERMLVALISGIVATVIVVISAGLGPELLKFLNINILKITGGIAVFIIGLMIAGIKIPQHLPTVVIICGFIISFIMR